MPTFHRIYSHGPRPRNTTAAKWMRILLHLIPLGAIAGGAAVAHLLEPHLGLGIAAALGMAMVIIVTLAAGVSNSILAWKQLDGPGIPKVSSIIADTIAFVFIVFFIIFSLVVILNMLGSFLAMLSAVIFVVHFLLRFH